MTNSFEGKVAMVTGAASGIGRATAGLLAERGAAVMACDINGELLEKEVADLVGRGLQVRACTFDVTDADACGQAVASTVEAFGRLDVLCNVAGMSIAKRFCDISRQEWDRVVAVNLTSVFTMCQAAMPHLLESKGNIVNVSSAAGTVGVPYVSPYCATKAGVLMMSKSLAVEFSGTGVRVNAICPGGVNTPLTQTIGMPEDADLGLITRVMPLVPFISEPDEIATAIAYLASDEARFVTGATFVIDGGQTAV